MTSGLNNMDWSLSASLSAIVLSQVSILVTNNSMEIISAISATILCLTAAIKFFDLLSEKIPKWRQRLKKGK